jgi:hypothetical protein
MNGEEIKNGIADAIKERMSSPFLSSIFLSWPLINYRLLLVFFGEGKYEEKLCYIDEKLYDFKWVIGGELYNFGWIEYWLHFAIIPILIGLFFTLCYPKIDARLTAIYVRHAHEKQRKAILAGQNEPIDKSFQAEYFAKWDEKNAALKKSVEINNKNYRELIANSAQNMQSLRERLSRQTLLRVAVECDGGRNDVESIRTTYSVINPNGVNPGKDLLLKHPEFSKLKKFVEEIMALPADQETGYRRENFVWLQRIVGVEEESIPDFIEMLCALGLIEDSETINQQQISLSPGQHAILMNYNSMVNADSHKS